MRVDVLMKSLFSSVFLLAGIAALADSPPDRHKPIVLDENLWVTFYDLPSRRFRTIRSALIARDFESAARDLSVTASYLSVENDRTSVVFRQPLDDVIATLYSMQERLDQVTLQELDAVFGRAHWLLAQHYLEFARRARDVRDARDTSLYLWATTHHMERAMLWNDVAIDSGVHKTLEGLRKLAGQLQDPDSAKRAFSEKPIVRAETLLRRIGEQIGRPVLLPEARPGVDQPGTD